MTEKSWIGTSNAHHIIEGIHRGDSRWRAFWKILLLLGTGGVSWRGGGVFGDELPLICCLACVVTRPACPSSVFWHQEYYLLPRTLGITAPTVISPPKTHLLRQLIPLNLLIYCLACVVLQPACPSKVAPRRCLGTHNTTTACVL